MPPNISVNRRRSPYPSPADSPGYVIDAHAKDTDPGGGLHSGGGGNGGSTVASASSDDAWNARFRGKPSIPTFQQQPQVIAGTSATSSQAVAQTASFPASPGMQPRKVATPVMQSGAKSNFPASPRPPAMQYGLIHSEVAPADQQPRTTVGAGETATYNGKPLAPGATVSSGPNGVAITEPGSAPTQFSGTGIIKDGKEVSAQDLYGANGRPISAGPMSFAEQQAAIVKAYPNVGVAGTPENKAFVDAYTKGGGKQEGALDLAHSLFMPKTDAQAATLQQQRQDAWAQRDKDEAFKNQTPEQRQAVVDQGKVRMDGLQAQADAAQPKGIAGSIGQFAHHVVDGLSDQNTVAPVVNGVKGFFGDLAGGFSGGSSAPSTPTIASAPSTSVRPKPVIPITPTTPTTATAPAVPEAPKLPGPLGDTAPKQTFPAGPNPYAVVDATIARDAATTPQAVADATATRDAMVPKPTIPTTPAPVVAQNDDDEQRRRAAQGY